MRFRKNGHVVTISSASIWEEQMLSWAKEMFSWAVSCYCTLSISFKLRHQLQTIPFVSPNMESENVKSENDGLENSKTESILQHLHGDLLLRKHLQKRVRQQSVGTRNKSYRREETLIKGLFAGKTKAGKRSKATSLPPGFRFSIIIWISLPMRATSRLVPVLKRPPPSCNSLQLLSSSFISMKKQKLLAEKFG